MGCGKLHSQRGAATKRCSTLLVMPAYYGVYGRVEGNDSEQQASRRGASKNAAERPTLLLPPEEGTLYANYLQSCSTFMHMILLRAYSPDSFLFGPSGKSANSDRGRSARKSHTSAGVTEGEALGVGTHQLPTAQPVPNCHLSVTT